jgi:LPXTG-motif cell wall-anchored protein
MQINRYVRAATATVLGGCASLAFAATASAAPVPDAVPINPGNVPATAANYEQECGENLGGGPYPGRDVWVFNLPGNAGKTGVFTSITATFDTHGAGNKTVVIEAGAADDDDIVFVGHSKAYVSTTAGWTLIGATASITGQADKFVLTHTCPAPTVPPTTTKPATTPATTQPATTPTTTTPTTTTPTTTPAGVPTTPTDTATGDSTPTPTTTPSPSPTPAAGTGTGDGGGLPLTGAAVSSIAAVGVALVGGGATLLLRRRRRFIA